MTRTIFAAAIGGLLLFIVQFLSWGLFNLHHRAQQYTSRQDSIMAFLQKQQLPEGGYLLPSVADNASMEEYNQMLQNAEGKPWATIQYHYKQNTSMGLNMVRGLATNILTVGLLCWIIVRMRRPDFRTIFMASLLTGFIVFLNAPYTLHIWYQSFDLYAHLFDAVAGWLLCGLWLAWYLPRILNSTQNTNRAHATSTSNID